MFGVISKPTRAELNPVVAVDLDLAKLAIEAETILGYTSLKKALGTGALSNVLISLQIDPFTASSVKKYQDAMQTMWRRKDGARYRYETDWVSCPISSYKNPIPEYVLMKALDIKKALPGVVFTVVELQVAQVPQDPFLVASFGDEDFYIEVWDEPEFESFKA